MAYGFKSGGRARGTPNKITTAFKDAVRTVYEDIGGHAAFAAWAKENPSEFYRICSKLISTEVTAPSNVRPVISVNINSVDSPDWCNTSQQMAPQIGH